MPESEPPPADCVQWADERERLQPFQDRLLNSLWFTEAAYKRYVEGKDGRNLLSALVALREYERLANPRLHQRLGYTLPESARLNVAHRSGILNATARMGDRLLKVESFARSDDIPVIRDALQMTTPIKSSRAQVEHHRMNLLTALQFVRIAKGGIPVRRDGSGNQYRLTNRTAVYCYVGATFGKGHQTVQRSWCDAIRAIKEGADDPRAWLSVDAAADPAFRANAEAARATQSKTVTPKLHRAAPMKPKSWQV